MTDWRADGYGDCLFLTAPPPDANTGVWPSRLAFVDSLAATFRTRPAFFCAHYEAGALPSDAPDERAESTSLKPWPGY